MKFAQTFLLLTIATVIHAQNVTKKSFAIANNGDTTWGTIKDKEFNVSPTSIKLNDIKYTTENIKAFATEDGTLYKRYTITYHTAPINESAMAFSDENKTNTTTTFLKVLVNAKNSLAEFRTNERVYYYVLNEQKAVELNYVKATVSFESKIYEKDARYGKTLVVEKSDYKIVLDSLNSANNKDIANKINNTWYDESSITKIVRLVNGFTQNTTRIRHNSLQVGLGFNYYLTSANGRSGHILRDLNVEKNIAPLISVAYKISPTRKINKSSYI